MSEQVTQRGKIRLIPNIEGEETYEKKAIELMRGLGKDQAWIDEYVEDYEWRGALSEAQDWREPTRFMVLHGRIYEVLEEERIDDGFFSLVTTNDDGSLSYITSYHNGGCGLEEAISSGMKP